MPLPNNKTPASRLIFYIIAGVVIPAAFTILRVQEPGVFSVDSANPTPLGYTVSLSLFVVPILGIAYWFYRNPDVRFHKTAFFMSLAILVPLGIVLDLLFGNRFFTFENEYAVLGIGIPAIGGDIPIEEIIFYITGFILVLLIYVWGDEFWFQAYNVPDYKAVLPPSSKILVFHPWSVGLGAVLFLAAIVYKTFFSGEAGFPWYFGYLLVVGIIPAAGLYQSVQHFINWRAFSFTLVMMVLISLLWEVTLALPYKWWGFQHDAMIGIYISPWHDLPIEETILWMMVSFASIITYETIKIWNASGQPLTKFLLGDHT
jgi:hypothetical protein